MLLNFKQWGCCVDLLNVQCFDDYNSDMFKVGGTQFRPGCVFAKAAGFSSFSIP